MENLTHASRSLRVECQQPVRKWDFLKGVALHAGLVCTVLEVVLEAGKVGGRCVAPREVFDGLDHLLAAVADLVGQGQLPAETDQVLLEQRLGLVAGDAGVREAVAESIVQVDDLGSPSAWDKRTHGTPDAKEARSPRDLAAAPTDRRN